MPRRFAARVAILAAAAGTACGAPAGGEATPAERGAEAIRAAVLDPQDPAPPAPALAPPSVWVVLTAPSAAGRARVRVAGGWSLLTLEGAPAATGRGLDAELSLAAGGATLGERPLPKDGARLVPATDGDLRVGDRTYPGELRVARLVAGSWLAAACMDLETYVASVVVSEVPAAFPREALRAQAIVARTYALSSAPRRQAVEPIVLADTGVLDQEFAGIAPVEAHRQAGAGAARSTHGLVLLDGATPVRAWYHSTCGGHTCPAAPVFKVPPSAPLVGVPCPWCAGTKYARWETRLPAAEVVKAARLQGPLESFAVAETTAGGRATSFDVKAGGRSRRVDAAEFRLAVGPSKLRSVFLDSAALEGAALVLRGRGWGHGVGLCQMGAKALAEKNVSAEEIVKVYYPGAQLLRLW